MQGNDDARVNQLIDVRDLIARYSNTEHIARADAYFSRMADDAPVLRKPFFGLQDTAANLYGAAELLNCLGLFRGARVLDFGAGTGWFSKMLAAVECAPVAVDVSQAALRMGEQALKQDPLFKDLDVEWCVFDGEHLPLADESVDRILCYDSFHHVADQAAVLREFHRVLRAGGRVAFHEPGPHHSRLPVSQYEMRHFDVIENDIVVEDIWRLAEPIGFTGMELVLAAPRGVSLPIDAYNRVVGGRASEREAAAVLHNLALAAINLRVFFFDKGSAAGDSRTSAGLGGSFKVTVTAVDADWIHGFVEAANTGTARWLRSGPEPGNVSLGVRRAGLVGVPDYGRIWLSGNGVAPGESVTAPFILPPPDQRPLDLEFDLVAEHVSWFKSFGTTPVVIRC